MAAKIFKGPPPSHYNVGGRPPTPQWRTQSGQVRISMPKTRASTTLFISSRMRAILMVQHRPNAAFGRLKVTVQMNPGGGNERG